MGSLKFGPKISMKPPKNKHEAQPQIQELPAAGGKFWQNYGKIMAK